MVNGVHKVLLLFSMRCNFQECCPAVKMGVVTVAGGRPEGGKQMFLFVFRIICVIVFLILLLCFFPVCVFLCLSAKSEYMQKVYLVVNAGCPAHVSCSPSSTIFESI